MNARGLRLLLLLLLLQQLLALLLLLQLLLEIVESGRHGLLDIDRSYLGRRGVDVVLTSGSIVVDLLALGSGSLGGEVLLLLVKGGLLLSKLVVADVELLELVSRGLDAPELLLEPLLLLCQIEIGSHKLGIQVGVHLLLELLIHGELRGSEHLVNSVLLSHHALVGLLLLLLLAVLGESRLGSIVGVALGVAIGVGGHAVSSKLLHRTFGRGRHGTKGSHGSRLGGRSQARKQMRSAGAGSGNAAVSVLVALLNGIKGQRLDVLAAAARGKAAGRNKVVGSHLSETACVHNSE